MSAMRRRLGYGILAALVTVAAIVTAPPARADVSIPVCRVQTANGGQWACTVTASVTAAKTQLQSYYSWVVNHGYVAQLVIYRDAQYSGDETLLYSGGPCTAGTNHTFELDEVFGSNVYGYWDNRISSISNATGWTHGSGCTVRLWDSYNQTGDSGQLSPGDASFPDLGYFGWDDTISSMTLVGS